MASSAPPTGPSNLRLPFHAPMMNAIARRRFIRATLALPAAAHLGCVVPSHSRRPHHARTLLFLGDSITWAGNWVVFVESWLRIRSPHMPGEVINLGLPSETVSGLSEPGHAGGAFPRPDLHERLGRALSMVRPDIVVACYGMNDGIYFPWSDARGQRHFDGLRRLHEAVVASGASIVHVTPAVFDPLPLAGKTLPAGHDSYPQPFDGYDGVLGRFSDWLLSRRSHGWAVVDAHGPMKRFLTEGRRKNPGMVLAADGVHPGILGHWLIARELIRHWGGPPGLVQSDSPDAVTQLHPSGPALVDLVARKQTLLRDAWLSHVGHLRPGMSKGMPIEQAIAKAKALHAELRQVLA